MQPISIGGDGCREVSIIARESPDTKQFFALIESASIIDKKGVAVQVQLCQGAGSVKGK
jgi:hypothetical protein